MLPNRGWLSEPLRWNRLPITPGVRTEGLGMDWQSLIGQGIEVVGQAVSSRSDAGTAASRIVSSTAHLAARNRAIADLDYYMSDYRMKRDAGRLSPEEAVRFEARLVETSANFARFAQSLGTPDALASAGEINNTAMAFRAEIRQDLSASGGASTAALGVLPLIGAGLVAIMFMRRRR